MTTAQDEPRYRMPAEWEPHASTWLAWPHNREDWPGKFAPIPWVYAEIVRHLVQSETVNILVQSEKAGRSASKILPCAGVDTTHVVFHPWKTDRVWLRDSMPSLVIEQTGPEASLAVIDWKFNAWAKYDNHRRDDQVPKRVARLRGVPRVKPSVELEAERVRIVLEGGAIDVNGRGTILTTEECLLSDIQARNPRLDRQAIEQAFKRYLGAEHTVWLNRGIVGDDTHGHVDDIARFVAPDTVVAVVENDSSDENHAPLQENLERLHQARDQHGQPLQVRPLPMPRPVFFEDQQLPASYANFYIANSVVLVPTFNDPADGSALAILSECFRDRTVVGIHARDLVWGLGTLHCLSREEPATSM